MLDETKIVFMGTPRFAVPSLYALYRQGYELAGVVTQPDRPRGRGQAVSFTPVKEAASGLGIAVYQPESLKEEGFYKQIKALAPELIVVAAFGQILTPEILALPKLGCINVHASLLPQYRGAAPIQRAVINGETVTGITTMLMDEGLDSGDILLQEEVEIPPDMTGGELHDLLAEKGADVLIKTIELHREGKIEPRKQDERGVSYAPRIKREEEKINWEESAFIIHNLIRGLAPRPGAHTKYKGNVLKITSAKIYEAKNGVSERAGMVTEIIKGQGFVVQAGSGSIMVKAVCPAGKKEMSAASFVNGYQLITGQVFN